MSGPVPKPQKRIKNSTAVHAKALMDRWCRCGCGRPATDGAHILGRGQGGDDVEDNVVGLYHECHMAIHNGDRDVARQVGAALDETEIDYVIGKLGFEPGWKFLEDTYERGAP